MTTFRTPINNTATTLAAPYTAGSGTMTVVAGFGSPSPSAPMRVSADHTDGRHVIFDCTGRTSNVLSPIAVVSSGPDASSDINLPSGSVVEVRWTAGDADQVVSSINAAESAIEDLQAGGGGVFIPPPILDLLADLPTPAVNLRGVTRIVKGSAGVRDRWFRCILDSDDTYTWEQF